MSAATPGNQTPTWKVRIRLTIRSMTSAPIWHRTTARSRTTSWVVLRGWIPHHPARTEEKENMGFVVGTVIRTYIEKSEPAEWDCAWPVVFEHPYKGFTSDAVATRSSREDAVVVADRLNAALAKQK
jgi:hypothetical protein